LKNILTWICLLWCQFTQAQTATFYGYVDSVDSLQVIFWNDYVLTTYGAREFTVPPGYFSFTLTGLDKPGKLYFKLADKDSYIILNDLVVESGDSIFMIAKRNDMANFSFTFSGKGQDKYHCKQELDKIYEDMDVQRFVFSKQHPKDYLDHKYLPVIERIYTDAEVNMKQTLRRYHCSAGTYLEADLLGQLRMFHDEATGQFYTGTDSAAKAYKRYSQPLDSVTDDQVRLSRNYVNCVLSKETTDYYHDIGKFTFQEMYHHLRQKYTGLVREWLLFNWILSEGAIESGMISNTEQVQYDQCVKDAYSLIRTPAIRELVKTRLNAYHSGAQVYNFALKDTAGHIVTMESLKGSVVLIDVWSTGCMPCAYFYKRMEQEILPEITNKAGLKIVSISMDNTRERWLKSIASGLYTNNQNINLRFNTSDNDPFQEHYKIAAIPFVMLVDRQGRLIQKINTSLEVGKDELKELLQKALD
jgi:hypothetical protein